MAANGINAVRTYTVPPRWLLDLALEHGLCVMVGLPWEQHVTFLDEPRPRRVDRASASRPACAPARATPPCSATRSATRSRPRSCAGTGGTGSSASSSSLYDAAKDEDPERARHLRQLPEHRVPPAPVRRHRLLQRLPRDRAAVRVLPRAAPEHRRRPPAGRHRDRPRLAAATARRRRRARSTGRSAPPSPPAARARSCSPGPTSGTAAASTSTTGPSASSTATRQPKQALAAVGRAFAETPFRRQRRPGRSISVVVCTYNSEDTLRELLRRAARARLPRLRGDRRQRRLDRRAPTRSRASTASG